MFVCEGCGTKVERVKRDKKSRRKPKPPFCRKCYTKSRDLIRRLARPVKHSTCRVCGTDLPAIKVAGTRHCSEECSAISRAAVIEGYRLEAELVLERDGWKCRACGVDTPKELRGKRGHQDAPQVDHIIPTSQGGSDDLSNKQCLCAFCNQSKRDRTMRQWIEAAGHSPDKVDRYLELYGHAA